MISEARFKQARINLSGFVLDRADEMRARFGVRYEAVSHGAPEALYQIRNEMKRAKLVGTFRVWSGASDRTIYTFPSGNHAFRFWHDCLHLDTQGTTTFADEVRIGYAHAEAVAREFGAGSVEHVLMLADTVGQALYYTQHGRFPEDQLAFARSHFTFEKE